MRPPFWAQTDGSKIDIVSAVWERPPVNISKFADLNQLESSIMIAVQRRPIDPSKATCLSVILLPACLSIQ